MVSAWLLRDDHDHHGHDHDHENDHAHGHHHHDNNLRAAYIHVLADAATSILAIIALLVAMYSQWVWADPAVGIIGSVLIASWAYGLLWASGAVLLDVARAARLGTAGAFGWTGALSSQFTIDRRENLVVLLMLQHAAPRSAVPAGAGFHNLVYQALVR